MTPTGDLSNIQWANRLGKRVVIRTEKEVVCGRVVGIGSHLITIEDRKVPRSIIVNVRNDPREGEQS